MARFLPLLLATLTVQVSPFSPHSLSAQRCSETNLGACNELSRREAWTTAAQVSAAGLLLPPFSAGAEKPLPAVPTVQLGSLEVSRTIMGQWQLAGGHGRYRESDAIDNMQAHFNAGITTLDTADIYGPSELIIGKFVKSQPKAIPCTKFCCFRYLDAIDRAEVRLRIQKVRRRCL